MRLKRPVRTYYEVYSSLSPESVSDNEPGMNIWNKCYPSMVPLPRVDNSF